MKWPKSQNDIKVDLLVEPGVKIRIITIKKKKISILSIDTSEEKKVKTVCFSRSLTGRSLLVETIIAI